MLDVKKLDEVINQIATEKKIPKSTVVEIIESAIKTAYKKDYGHKDDIVNVHINFEEAIIELTVEKTIVEEVENPRIEISISDVHEEMGEDADEFEVGDVIELDASYVLEENKEAFGRIAAQAARQVIIQKFQETEKEKIYDLFKDKQGTVVTLKVDLVERNRIMLDYNGNLVHFSKSEQVARDKYSAGQRLSFYVALVEHTDTGNPRVVLSRKRAEFIQALFETHVPEIQEGTVEILKVVRRPGLKSKILVDSPYDEIDPAGCLIGPKGMRVQTIVDELNGERVDVINYTDDLKELVRRTLTPAEIKKIEINEDDGEIICVLNKEESGKAMGKWKANLTLAEDLLGYDIYIETLPEAWEEEKWEEEKVEKVEKEHWTEENTEKNKL